MLQNELEVLYRKDKGKSIFAYTAKKVLEESANQRYADLLFKTSPKTVFSGHIFVGNQKYIHFT